MAPAFGGGGIEKALQPRQVGETEQLLCDVRLPALAFDQGEPIDDVGQHLVEVALAPVHLFGDVQRPKGVMERLGFDRLRQYDYVVGAQQADAADLPEVHAHRVVQRDRINHLDVEHHLVVDLLDLYVVLLPVRDLNPEVLEGTEDGEDLVRLGVDLGKALEDVTGREVALLPALDDQLLGKCDQLVLELALRSLYGLVAGLDYRIHRRSSDAYQDWPDATISGPSIPRVEMLFIAGCGGTGCRSRSGCASGELAPLPAAA